MNTVANLVIEMAANVARLRTDMNNAVATVDKAMNSIKKAASQASYALGGIGAALSVRELVRAMDAYTKFNAQLKLSTSSAEQYAKAQESVRLVAKEAQSDISAIGVLYSRISNATKELNISQAQVVDVTRSVGLALKVSGATAAESASAMLQLSQAFGSGLLRGEEFNAVNEAAPRIMKALADGMGVPIGQLRKMASEGQITAKIMAEALPLALQDLIKEAQNVQTIGSAFQTLKNELLLFVGAAGEANNVTGFLAGTLNDLSTIFGVLNSQTSNATGNMQALQMVQEGIATVFETVIALGVNVSYVLTQIGNEIGGIAAQIASVFRTGGLDEARAIREMMIKDAQAAREQVDKTTEAIVNSRKNNVASMQMLDHYSKENVKSLMGVAGASEKAAKAAEKLAEAQKKARQAADELVASIAFETETMQMSNLEREIATNLLKLEKTGLEQNTEEYRAYAEAIRLATIENEGIKERIKLEKEGAEARKKIEEDFAKQMDQINFQIGQSLTDQLINGGKTAKEFLIDMFKTLILRPILQPIITGGTSMVMGALGMGASGSAMATPGSLSNTAGLGQIGSLASTMNSLYTGIAGGFTAVSGAIGSGLASLAAATESASLASFAAGMQGASLAPGLAGPTTAGATGAMGAGATAAAFTQGVAGIGAGVLAGEFISGGKSLIGGNSLWTTGGGAAAGAAIGTAVLPGIGTAIGGLIGGIVGGIANAAFGSGAKELQGSGMARGTITGGGLQGAEFYQNWKKAGGWFTSDKYGQDVSGMSSELVTYINDASQAIRDSGKDYATLLQLSADGIDAVTLSFDFAVGSMEQLTENLGNTLDDYANKVADAILAGTNFGKAGETSYETIQRLVNSLNIVNPIFDTLGLKMFDMSAAGGAAASAFIDLMGGIEGFTQATDFYYQNFYSEAERTEKSFLNLRDIFKAMNLELPNTNAQFRQMVETAQKAGDDVLTANLLKLAPAFNAMNNSLTALATQAAQANLTKAISASDYAFRSLQSVVNKQKQSIDQNRQAIQQSIDGMQSLFDFINQQISELLGATSVSTTSAWSYITQAASGTITPTQDALVNAVSKIRESFNSAQYKTAFELQKDRALLANQLQKIGVKTSDQIIIAEEQLSAADKQLAELDAILNNAQAQLDAARGIKSSVENGTMTVESAIANMQAAITAELAAIAALANIGKTSPITSVREQAVVGLFNDILERDPKEEGLRYWADSNLTIAEIAKGIEDSQENRQQEVTRMFNNILGRDPLAQGLAYWAGSNMSLAEVEAAIKASPEAKAKGYASGGYYPGGLAMVGERGPELINFNDPGMVYNASQTSKILTGGDDVVMEIRNLREENQVQSRALVNLQNRMTRLLERWDGDGLPEERMVTA